MKQILNILFIILICIGANAQTENEHWLKGLASLQRKAFTEAIDEFDKAIEVNNHEYQYYLKRGNTYFRLKDYAKAENDFTKASQLEKYSGSLGLAMVSARTGDTDLAVKHLQDHLSSRFRIPEKAVKLNKAFENIDDSRKWVELWKKDWYSSFEKLERDVDYLIKNEHYLQAIDMVDVYISKYPEKAEAYAIKGGINYARGKIREAELDLTKGVSLDPKNPLFLKKRALVYTKAGKHQSALKDISDAIEYDPSMFDLYIKRAGLYKQMNKGDKALSDLNKYLNYFPADETALSMCGKIYINQDKYYSALKYFSLNVKYNPDKPGSFIDRADAYVLSENYKYAIKDYGMALDLDPSNAITWLNRGKVYIKTGNIEKACFDLKRAARLKNREAIKLYREYCVLQNP